MASDQDNLPVIQCIPTAIGNPYQALMYYAAKADFQVNFESGSGIETLLESGAKILHIHWDDRVFGRQKEKKDNLLHLKSSMDILMKFKAGGGKILWTIHNRVPHRTIDQASFEHARRLLVHLVDVIHVHAPHAAEYMMQTFDIPAAKICIIPHPSYMGVYESARQTVTRPLLNSTQRKFLFFGMFRGEKGVQAIRKATGKLTARGLDYQLKMYGKAFASQRGLTQTLEANPRVDLRVDRIPDSEVPDIFGSSHVYLAPFKSMFTSGSVMLAQTFGLPVIGPNIREMRETTPVECHSLLYDPESPRGLLRKMIQVIEMDNSDITPLRRRCFAFANERSALRLGREMREILINLAATPT